MSKSLLIVFVLSTFLMVAINTKQPVETYPRRYNARAVWRQLPRRFDPRGSSLSFNYLHAG